MHDGSPVRRINDAAHFPYDRHARSIDTPNSSLADPMIPLPDAGAVSSFAAARELFHEHSVNNLSSISGLDHVMSHEKILSPYNPATLLDALARHLQLTSDHALSRKLKVTRQVIDNIRSGTLPVGASMLLWMHEASGISIDELRRLMGDRRAKCRPQVCLSRASIHRRGE